ncbi:helix-turn-helix domain-containing protein [Candidatus Poribacteria bacterium]|nr:helix-turn-helix domain-containing protein [Candidatus Poribacteria bacterium]
MTETQLLTEAQVASMLSIHIQTVAKMRREGLGPRFVELLSGKRKTYRYAPADVQSWIDERTQEG